MELLRAVFDGHDRLTYRPASHGHSYDGVGRRQGVEYDLLGPWTEDAQQYPGLLAALGRRGHAGGPVRRWVRRHVGGTEEGEFTLPVGGCPVAGSYRARWEWGRVAELVITLPSTSAVVAAAASRDLRALAREVWGSHVDGYDGPPPVFDHRWGTETVVALASAIYTAGAYDRLPILADALEEAGCDDPELLADCRDPQRPSARGERVVELVLGYV